MPHALVEFWYVPIAFAVLGGLWFWYRSRNRAVRPKTFEAFISLLRQHGCSTVIGFSSKKTPPTFPFGSSAHTAAVGVISTSTYWGIFKASTPEGRTIEYVEPYNKHFGSEYGFADYESRQIAALKGIYTTYKRLEQIKERIPDITVTLTGGERPIPDELIERMHQDVQNYELQTALKQTA